MAPLVLAITILGTLSVRHIQSYVEDNARRVNAGILQQAQSSIDTMLDELNAITLNFSVNTRAQYGLRRILRKERLDLEDVRELEIIRNIISISHYSRPYIQSIYVYFDNPAGRFITSEETHTSLDRFADTEWYHDYVAAPAQTESWWKLRQLRRNDWSDETIPVLSLYKQIFSGGLHGYGGVVVFNVYLDYLRASLRELQSHNEQTIFIVDRSQVLVAGNDHRAIDPHTVLDLPAEQTEIRMNGRTYTVSSARSKYDLYYISVIPNTALYAVANYVSWLNMVYVAVSLAAGVGLSLYFASVANRQIRTITEIIRSARDGHLHGVPTAGNRLDDSHQFILYNIINTFIEKDYLAVQLSEKAYKSRVDELTALQSQINPHFIFNTLQTINMKAMAHGPVTEDITSMIGHLSHILRYSLSDPGGLVCLDEEISHAKSYLAIQSVRYRDKMVTRWHYDDSVTEYQVIKLLFQPLLENSIYHGLNERDGCGEIEVHIREEAETLVVIVEDTGAGVPPDKLTRIQAKLNEPYDNAEHIGLFNTNRRIKLMHGEQYGIAIHSEFGRGTRVLIHVPKVRV